ncbi:TetR/AcrR family transcriptional regulator [Granulicoccus sp. GXG6511]|uniref:TetR/AcrR family transcriptional regulator n=1 Tax=Granulicoccus sp. GXG6511 TaxID=3381351 RepID=UPI003D7EF550
MTTRPYDNSARREAAAATRHRIIVATTELLAAEGYAGLGVMAVARAADVSQQTIYNSIGGKSALLKACYDVTLAGDEDEVPMSQRPEFSALREAGSADEWVERYAAWSRLLSERVHPILGPLVGLGVARDAGAAEFLTTIEQERRVGSTHAMTAFHKSFGLPDGLSLEQAIDICWTLNSPELYARLVGQCGWTPEEYQSWLAGELRASFLATP